MKSRLFLTLLFLLFAFPLVVLALYAAAPGWNWPHVWPDQLSTRSLEYLVSQHRTIALHLLWSTGYSLTTVACTLLLCVLPAHHFARREFRGKTVLEALLLAPALVPAMTFSMGVHVLFIHSGLADTTPGVILVLTTFSYPYMLRALITGFQSYGEEYDLCAKNLGAGRWTRLIKVELPMLAPAMAAGASIVFLVAFSEYFLVFLIGGGAVPSYTGFLFPLLNSSDRAVGSMLCLLFLVVPIVLFVAMETILARTYKTRGMY